MDREALKIAGVLLRDPPAEANRKFRRWASTNHPDVGGDESTFARVSSAVGEYVRWSRTIVVEIRF